MRVVSSAAGIAFALAIAGCHAEQLAPPPAPPRALPAVAVPETPPASGTGRVVLDADGDRAHANEVGDVARPLCTTPCVVDLAYGAHPLLFSSISDDERRSEVDLDVGPRPKVVRHRLAERRQRRRPP